MAKTSSVEKNNRRRKLVKQYANKRAKLKAIIQNKEITMEERFAAQLKLAELPRNSAKNRIRNRCEVTGRPVPIIANLRCRVWRFARCPTWV